MNGSQVGPIHSNPTPKESPEKQISIGYNNAMPKRIPYDVVYLILTKALHTPLLPHPNYDLFECETMFSSRCCSDILRRESERLARTLRLVCREWNELVPKLQPRLMVYENRPLGEENMPPHVLYRPGPGTLSEAHRLEINQLGLCRRRQFNKCPAPSSCRYFKWALTQAPILENLSSRAIPSFILTFRMEQLQVLVSNYIQSNGMNKEILDRMPSLKAIWWPGGGGDTFLADLTHHPVHTQLTHLRISLKWDQFTQLVDPIHFPDLRYLALLISGRTDEQPPLFSAEKMKWAIFPRLHTLQFRAYFVSVTSEYFYSFLTACRSTLSSLILHDVSSQSLPDSVPLPDISRLYNLFPHLTAFGPNLDVLYLNPPPPPSSHPPMVLVVHPLIYRYSSLNITVDARIASLIQACHDWGKSEIRFLDTWQEATTLVQDDIDFYFTNRAFYIPFQLKFYDRSEQSGVTIRDRDGSLITSPQGEAFIQALRERWAMDLV